MSGSGLQVDSSVPSGNDDPNNWVSFKDANGQEQRIRVLAMNDSPTSGPAPGSPPGNTAPSGTVPQGAPAGPESSPASPDVLNAAEVLAAHGVDPNSEIGKEYTAQVAALQTEWGNSYEEKVSDARWAVAQLERDMPWLADVLDRTGLGDSPLVIKFFAELATLSPSEGSPAEIDQQIREATADPDYLNPGLGHEAAVARVTALYARKFSGRRR